MTRILILFLLLISQFSFSQTYSKLTDSKECQNMLLNKSKKTVSITADFKEIVHSSMLTKTKEATGRFLFKEEQKIRWEKTTPNSEIIIFNGDEVKYKKDNTIVSNASTKRMVKRIQSLMLKLLNGDYINENDFAINYYENETNYQLILNPNKSSLTKYISYIRLTFNKIDLHLLKFTLFESEDDYVEYEFSSVAYNTNIDELNFNAF